MFKNLKLGQIILLILIILLCSICLFGIINSRRIPMKNTYATQKEIRMKVWSLCVNAKGVATDRKIQGEIYALIFPSSYGDYGILSMEESQIKFPDKNYPLFITEVENAEAILCVQIKEKTNDEKTCKYSGELNIPLRGIQTQLILITYPEGDLIAKYTFENDARTASCPVKIMCSTAAQCKNTIFHADAHPGDWLSQYVVP